MRDVPQIKAAYDWVREAGRSQKVADTGVATPEATAKLVDHVGTLERGVFVMLIGQLEKAVVECFEQARDSRGANPDWTVRRGWDIPAYGRPRIPFETMLALVVDRRSPAFGSILQSYAVRNHCAHGGTSQVLGSIDKLVDDLYEWQALLRK